MKERFIDLRRLSGEPTPAEADPAGEHQLKILAAEQQTTVHRLVCTGLNAVFAEHHKPEIAR